MKAKIFAFAVIAAIMASCGPKDAAINKAVQGVIEQYATGINATTEKGVVTLAGELDKEINFDELETALKAIKGVKGVVNNLTVKVEEPVITPDDALTLKINELLTIDKYKGVAVTVLDGEVTLTGTIVRADLMGLIQTISELQPKKINNNLNIK
ncbi:MAG: BON domain-containing protein [Lentimicrobium sp.]|nr:BON domain-containing protein [Lentimicrobium sp.]